MHFSTIILAFAATVLAAPMETTLGSGLRVRGDLDQGDGFYVAIFNEEGVADIEFTPMAKAKFKARAPVSEVPAAHSGSNLFKRGTVCSGRRSGNLAQLDDANVALARNAAAQGWYDKHANGWVHNFGETSYFCNYQGNQLNYDMIIGMHSTVTAGCGRDAYGFVRNTNCCGVNDLAVGRTFRGDGFC